MTLAAIALGALVFGGGVWLGFYLGRLDATASPSAPIPTDFGGTVLDAAYYPEADDE